jgi:WD40 repeat protein
VSGISASISIFTGSYDGIVSKFDIATGAVQRCSGKGHTNGIVALAVAGDNVLSVAIDDTARLTPAASPGGFTYTDQLAALGATPKAVAVSPRNPGTAIAITAKAMVVLDAGKVTATVPLTFPASCVSISPDGVTVAVGAEDNKVTIQAPRAHPFFLTVGSSRRFASSPWREAVFSNLLLNSSATALV